MTGALDTDLRHNAFLLLMQICNRSTEWRARPHVRGPFHVEHWVVFAQLGGVALDAHVENEREDGGESACDCERRHGFVETADHDASFVVPSRDGATVAEGPGEVPGKEGEGEDPEHC